jgi:hypothetical protein
MTTKESLVCKKDDASDGTRAHGAVGATINATLSRDVGSGAYPGWRARKHAASVLHPAIGYNCHMPRVPHCAPGAQFEENET